jgi:hypothetical protein
MPQVGFEQTISEFEVDEDNSCLRPRNHCDRPNIATRHMEFCVKIILQTLTAALFTH